MSSSISRSAELLRDLLRCRSVTPDEGGALGVLQTALEHIGFEVQRITFSAENTADVENLYARLGNQAPHICFAGHTDVVPAGPIENWKADPFSGDIIDGEMIGRGAVDMKGAIACFISAVETFVANNKMSGSISFLITGDEEGPSINGTDKLLQWAEQRGEVFDGCIVGEPVNPDAIGDMIKIGRRGSLSGRITVNGIQGHSAYPHLADNPAHGMVDMLDHLLNTPFDEGTDDFQPSNLEVTSIDIGNPAVNVIAADAQATFNIRFNETWNEETLKQEIVNRFEKGVKAKRIRSGKSAPLNYDIEWIGRVSPVFLTHDDTLISLVSKSVEKVTGKIPELSTGGGTSDARFIKNYCPVVEFGLVGQSMHQINERTPLSDLTILTDVYGQILQDYFT